MQDLEGKMVVNLYSRPIFTLFSPISIGPQKISCCLILLTENSQDNYLIAQNVTCWQIKDRFSSASVIDKNPHLTFIISNSQNFYNIKKDICKVY